MKLFIHLYFSLFSPRLKPKITQELLRVKMNGPPLQLFNAKKYVKKYLKKTQNYRCDNPGAGGQLEEESNNELEDDFGVDIYQDFKNRTIMSGKSTIFM